MEIKQKRIVTISLTLNEYDGLIKQIERDKQSYLICFKHIRRVGRAYKKELVSVKLMSDTGLYSAEQVFKAIGIKEFFVIEHGLRGYEAFYSTLDGKFDRERALIKLEL